MYICMFALAISRACADDAATPGAALGTQRVCALAHTYVASAHAALVRTNMHRRGLAVSRRDMFESLGGGDAMDF
jgi:hypothetical protein